MSESIGIIAGGGKLPYILIRSLKDQGLKPVIVGIQDFAKPDLIQDEKGTILPIGSAGSIIHFLKENQVRDLVFVGRVSRPNWMRVKPDARGISIVAKILLKKTLGDDALLKLLRDELERDGLYIKPVQDFVPDILTPEGVLTTTQPDVAQLSSIQYGFQISQEHGRKDLGQSVVVQNETILGLEDVKGTDALIEKCGQIKQAGKGPILVKTCKPQQDKALDLPTIGTETIEKVVQAGFSGIVVQAGETLIVDREEVVRLCDENGIFLIGYKP